MRATPLCLLVVVLAGPIAGCRSSGGDERPAPEAPAAEMGRAASFDLRRAAGGLVRPVWAGQAPGDRDGLWVVEQPGRVIRVEGRTGRRRIVLDLRREVVTGAEQGLLGLAFDPDFRRTGRFYLHWSQRPHGDTRVAEFRTDGRRRARRLRTLLEVEQPEENHNGGQLAFAPDGRLHLGLGDGGGAFDPRDRAQDPRSPLGKLLAADVARPGRPRWKVVLSGLRNPYRFSFDPALNEVWIGDVGQDGFEEVDRVALEADEPPKNLGWPAYEGVESVGDRKLDERGELVFPVGGYPHDGSACSITGGVVYRGVALPALAGRYVYGDYCAGTLWSARPRPGAGLEDVRRERALLPELTHIGTDAAGELVLASARGDVLRSVPPGGLGNPK